MDHFDNSKNFCTKIPLGTFSTFYILLTDSDVLSHAIPGFFYTVWAGFAPGNARSVASCYGRATSTYP